MGNLCESLLLLYGKCLAKSHIITRFDTCMKIKSITYTSVFLTCRQVCGGIFLITDWYRRVYLTVGDAILVWVVLGGKRKHAGKVMRSKAVSSRTLSWRNEFLHSLSFSSCLELLLWPPYLMDLWLENGQINQRNSFLSSCFWSECFITASESTLYRSTLF